MRWKLNDIVAYQQRNERSMARTSQIDKKIIKKVLNNSRILTYKITAKIAKEYGLKVSSKDYS